jgi:hypothetical protein
MSPEPLAVIQPKPLDKRAFNAYRHGLTGHVLVVTPADQAAYQKHCQGVQTFYSPSGYMETDLVQSIADDRWRMKRAVAMETNILARDLNEPDDIVSHHDEVDAALATARGWLDDSRALERLSLYESRIQRRIEKNIVLLRQLQQDRREALQKLVEEVAILDETYDFPEESLPPQFDFSLPKIRTLARHHRRLQDAGKVHRRAA